ncbi:hypothetical protein B0T14DRAFT_567987 [Immersiella caudata]|uniref:Neuraminidase-like domain-containing protein n=1 Tax=Immersiella caudata TaxID=314043 RepID=A0AA39WJ86_9PEZI|nr:hypothetical protein B0T14DRAFT_567987 [Immersiella caudata]
MSPWLPAQLAVDSVELCTKVTAAGFEFKQLTYIFLDKDDNSLRTFGPTITIANRLASSLYTDLKAIDAKYTPVSTLEDATGKAVESTAGYYALKTKLKYVPGVKPRVRSVEQLTEDEKLQAKRLAAAGSPSESKWISAIDRLSKQAVTFLKNYLGGICGNLTAAEGALTGGDEPITDPADSSRCQQENGGATKRLDITATLLEEFLVIGGGAGPGQPATTALDAVLAIDDDQVSPDGWRGHPMVSSAQTCHAHRRAGIYAFNKQQDDPTDVWVGRPIKLFGGKLYELVMSGQQTTSLVWMKDASEPASIPSSGLIPSHASGGIKPVLSLLVKSSFIINNFKLRLDGVRHFGHWGEVDFAGFSWHKIDLANGPHLSSSRRAESIPGQTHQVTLWEQSDISQLLSPSAFDMAKQTAEFRNEVALAKMQISVPVARRVGIPISSLFQWGHPLVRYLDGLVMVHFFARTPASPYKYFYRALDGVYMTWTPWQQMQVDIPSLFQATAGDNTKKASDSLPLEYWEIKFDFNELRNGIWKQKMASTDAVWKTAVASTHFAAGAWRLPVHPRAGSTPAGKVPLDTITHIHVLRGSTTKVGKFSFDGSRVFGNGAASKQGPGSSTLFPAPERQGSSAPDLRRRVFPYA